MTWRLTVPRYAVPPALLLLAACEMRPFQPPQNEAEPPPANIATPAPAPTAAAPEPLLDREAILVAAIRARSAAMTGADDRAAQAALDGRRFAFRIRLGCGLSQAPDAPVRFDPATRRVELNIVPDLTAESPVAAAIVADGYEAVEGFWVADPWVLTPHCGSGASAAVPVGIAQFFSAEEPRTARRDGRPYQARQDFAGGGLPGPGDWELVLTGRLARLADGRAIQCRAPNPEQGPVCIVSVRFDQVEMSTRHSGLQLAQWRSG